MEAQDFRNQLQAESDMILYGYLFDPIYRCYTQSSLQKQAAYEKQRPYSVLEKTPNYRSRVQEAEDCNRREIEMHGEENRAKPVQDAAAEAERIRKEAEEKEAKRLKEKADRKAARKAEKKERKEKEQKREEKKAKKAEKKEKKNKR